MMIVFPLSTRPDEVWTVRKTARNRVYLSGIFPAQTVQDSDVYRRATKLEILKHKLTQ